jgi:DNA-binding XRE family transcriptional regulator
MNKVKAWRLSRAPMTQERAAEILGLSWRQYQRIEAGKSKPSGSVARLLDVLT